MSSNSPPPFTGTVTFKIDRSKPYPLPDHPKSIRYSEDGWVSLSGEWVRATTIVITENRDVGQLYSWDGSITNFERPTSVTLRLEHSRDVLRDLFTSREVVKLLAYTRQNSEYSGDFIMSSMEVYAGYEYHTSDGPWFTYELMSMGPVVVTYLS